MNSYSGFTRHYILSAVSDRGRRKERNEDYYGIFEPESEELLASKGILVAVADGMGGLFRGARASRTMVDATGEAYYASNGGNSAENLYRAFANGNERVFKEVGGGIDAKAGTTCTAAVLLEDHAHIAHVGDSRAYLIGKEEYRQITVDHSYQAPAEGHRSKRTDADSKRRVMTRSLGLRKEVKIDLIKSLRFAVGETLLICSDGLFSSVPSGEIASTVHGKDPKEAVMRLVKLALKAGGDDNITVLAAKRVS